MFKVFLGAMYFEINLSLTFCNIYRNIFMNTRTFFFSIVVGSLSITLNAQVGIGTSAPDSSAVLDLTSTVGGLLLPRMTTSQIFYINNPKPGLIVFNTDSMDIWLFKGTRWEGISNPSDTLNPSDWYCGLDILYGNKFYKTVYKYPLCWMKENLNIGTRIDKTQNQSQQFPEVIEKYCYLDLEDSCDVYGGLYQWNEMMGYTISNGATGICPAGWHLPTDSEWTDFVVSFGGESVSGGKMKEPGTSHWQSPNTGASNTSGFTGLGGGRYRSSSGVFDLNRQYGLFWSSTFSAGTLSWRRYLAYDAAGISNGTNTWNDALSVRCVREDWDCGDDIVYEGKNYPTVQIGSQCWMKKNLDVGTRINGTQNQSQQIPEVLEKYCYNDLDINCTVYGGLYQWGEMMQYVTTSGAQGICPDGWHIPTSSELTQLSDYLGGNTVAGGKLKEAGTAHWLTPNTGATNESGFTGLPGGRYVYGYSNLTELGMFWSSTQVNVSQATYRYLYFDDDNFLQDAVEKVNAYSLRCLKN